MPSPRCSPLIALSPYTQAALSLAQSRPPSSVDVPFLRAQLDTLETTLSTLLAQRLALTARLTEAVALSSPIRLLSTELLSAIFVASTLPSHSSPHDAPVLLSTLMLVCKQWRDICLCTPDLWSRISISPNEPESFEKARRRLIRSKAVPLDIFLDFSPRSSFSAQANVPCHSTPSPVTPDHLLKTSLLLLRPTISRWRTFVLLVPYRPQVSAALALCSSPAPLLEKLRIQVSNPMLHAFPEEWNGDRALTRPTLPFRGITPRLRECSLTSFWCECREELATSPAGKSSDLSPIGSAATPRTCEFGGDRLAPGMDMLVGRTRIIFPGVGPRLTKLRLVGFWNDFAPTVEEMLSVFRQCPLLEEINIRNMSDVDPIDDEFNVPTSSPIVMRRLRYLSFYYSGVTRTCGMLHRIALPALERLELSFLDNITTCLKHLKQQAAWRYGYDYTYAFGCEEEEYKYRQHLGVTQFPLKSLRIEASLFNEFKLMRLLRRLPYLEKLELVDVEDISSNLLKGLSSPIQPNEWILPRLDTLNLEGCTSVEWDDLKALVEGRLPSSSASSSAAAAAAFLRHRGMSTSSTSYTAIRSGKGVSSSASEYARGNAMTETPYTSKSSLAPVGSKTPEGCSPRMTILPQKIAKLDLTRCSQISRERVQWLRMYVGEVVCESGKGVDGVV